jgi:hypothetical protein
MMQNQWQSLGNSRPQYLNDRVHKAFEFGLPLRLIDKKAESKAESQAESKAQLDMAEEICNTLANGSKSKSIIANALGKKQVDGQLNSQIRKLLKDGRIEYTIPQKPNSRLQQYRLSKKD